MEWKERKGKAHALAYEIDRVYKIGDTIVVTEICKNVPIKVGAGLTFIKQMVVEGYLEKIGNREYKVLKKILS